jgi:hypothetical protein
MQFRVTHVSSVTRTQLRNLGPTASCCRSHGKTLFDFDVEQLLVAELNRLYVVWVDVLVKHPQV